MAFNPNLNFKYTPSGGQLVDPSAFAQGMQDQVQQNQQAADSNLAQLAALLASRQRRGQPQNQWSSILSRYGVRH